MTLSSLFPDYKNFLDGKNLIGDNATESQSKIWYEEESGAYAKIMNADIAPPIERSKALNSRHYSHIFKNQKNLTGFVLGPADATELLPLSRHFKHWYAMEPAPVYQNPDYYTCKVTFVTPSPSNTLYEVPPSSIDVVFSLSVLHHIANVSNVIKEFANALKPGGLLILREPTVTMGNWDRPRKNLTPYERGLPEEYLLKTLSRYGFKIIQNKSSVFSPWNVLCSKLGLDYLGNRKWYIMVDGFLSALTYRFARYYRPHIWQKFAPSVTLLIAQKK